MMAIFAIPLECVIFPESIVLVPRSAVPKRV
jgi:hypothetical protein